MLRSNHVSNLVDILLDLAPDEFARADMHDKIMNAYRKGGERGKARYLTTVLALGEATHKWPWTPDYTVIG